MNRARIIEIARALRAKTVENGCTEAEALAAAEKLADILARHNIDLDEEELRASPFTKHEETHGDDVGDRLWKVAAGIAVMSDVKWWTSRAGVHPVEIGFFGLEHEVEIARYLLEVCAGAMRREHCRLRREWALLTPVAQRRKTLPFLDGMADRLGQRIAAMKPPAPAGRGLVVLKGQLTDAALARAGINIRDGATARSSRTFEASYDDGRRAADQVALNPGLSGRPATLSLGARRHG